MSENEGRRVLQMIPYCLTRLLYPIDEVCLSLLTALVDKRTLDECYYWAAEIHESGFDLMAFLWSLYLDFYAELNPRLEAFIRRKWAGKAGLAAGCAVIRNLHRARPTVTVFALRQAVCSDRIGIGAGTGRIYAGFPVTHSPWLDAVEKGDGQEAAARLYSLASSWCTDSLFRVLVSFHESALGARVKTRLMEKYWEGRPGHDDLHHLLAIMVHMWRPECDLDMRKVFVCPGTEVLAYQAPPTPFGRPDRLLGCSRRYPIDQGIGMFDLARDSIPSPLDALRHHWEYYAYRCPLWRDRIDALGGTPDHQTRTISFRSNEGLEAFYGLYGLEPDEQPMDLQEMSTDPLPRMDAALWLERNGVALPLKENRGQWRFRTEIDATVKA